MSEQKPPTGYVISNAVQRQRQSPAAPDHSRLSDILVKSPKWKKNVLGAGSADPGSTRPELPEGTDPGILKASLLHLIERHWLELVTDAQSGRGQEAPSSRPPAENDDIVDQDVGQTAATGAAREGELRRLREQVLALEAENTELAMRYENEVNTRKTELRELRKAFVQFQHESDQLLSELDNQKAMLRITDPE
ncbi:MAG: hypothetical protein HKN64_08155 [Woeseiaceae bacterium]|nr:hypothetical protein [Woeseiaceae bacterium]